MTYRKLATVGGIVLLVVFVLLSLLRCGGSVCACPLGYVCVVVEKPSRAWRCEPSPMPPTWLTDDGGAEAAK